MAAFEAERFDVGTGRFGDPQPVEGEQADEGVVAGARQPGATSIAPTSLRSRDDATRRRSEVALTFARLCPELGKRRRKRGVEP